MTSTKFCPHCGKVMTTTASICPHCGEQQPAFRRKNAPVLIGVLLVGFVLVVLNYGSHGPSSPSITAVRATQNDFCNLLQDYAQRYRAAERSGANEAELSQLRYERKTSLLGLMGRDDIADWRGIVKWIATDRDGTGRLKIQLICQGEPAEIELYSDRGIKLGTGLYSTLISLNAGNQISISGAIRTGGSNDYLHETSLTEMGSMTDPEFDFDIASISAEN